MITSLVLQLILLFPQIALITNNDMVTQSISVNGNFTAKESHRGEMDIALLAENPTLTDFATYENPRLGIQIEHPADWKIDESIPDGVIFKSPKHDNTSSISSEYLIVFVHTGDFMTLDEITQEQIESLKTSVPNLYLNQSESATTMLAGNPAYRAVFDTKEDNVPFKLIQIWGIEGKKVFYVTYRLERDPKLIHDYIGVVNKMINSIKISNFSQYENPILGIKTLIPSNWVKEEVPDNDSVVFAIPLIKSSDEPQKYMGSVTLTTENNLQNSSLNEYMASYVTSIIRNDSNSNIIYEDNGFSLGKEPAHVLVYTTKENNDDNIELVNMKLTTIMNNRVYSVEYRIR